MIHFREHDEQTAVIVGSSYENFDVGFSSATQLPTLSLRLEHQFTTRLKVLITDAITFRIYFFAFHSPTVKEKYLPTAYVKKYQFHYAANICIRQKLVYSTLNN